MLHAKPLALGYRTENVRKRGGECGKVGQRRELEVRQEHKVWVMGTLWWGNCVHKIFNIGLEK